MDLNAILVSCQHDPNMVKYIEDRLPLIKRYIFNILESDLKISSDRITTVISNIIGEKCALLAVFNAVDEGVLKETLKRKIFMDILLLLKHVLDFQKWTQDYPSLYEKSASESPRERHFRLFFNLFCGTVDRAKYFVPYLRTPRSKTGHRFSALNCAITAFNVERNFDLGMTILDHLVDEEVKNFDDLMQFDVSFFRSNNV